MIKELFGKEQSNKGYSLVEVIVAVIILAIVTVPLLTAFILSAKINQKARVAQETTVAAQSVMEDFKQTNVDLVYKLYTSGADGRAFVSETPSTPSTPKIYEFAKNGIDVSGKVFDAKILVSEHIGTTGDVILANPISATFDYVFMQKPDDDKQKYISMLGKAASFLNLEYNNQLSLLPEVYEFGKYTADNVDKSAIKMKRSIIITVSDNADPSLGYDVKNEIKYSGKISGLTATDKTTKLPTTVNRDDFDNIDSFVGSSDTKTYKELNNIYIFYYPGYDTSDLSIVSDKIEIKNTSSLTHLNVYLIKQKYMTVNDGLLMNLEIGYRPTIVTSGSINLHSNIKTNLSSLTDVETSATVPGDKIIVKKATNDAGVFDVKVQIFESGTANLLYTLNGSMDSNKDKE